MTDNSHIKVSVVIPLYNKQDYVERAVRSALSQTLQGIEVIVIDDGSTDNSAAIVNSIQDSRISLIRQENAGVSAARNSGIQQANSELIAFLDADDMWFPHHLAALIRLKQNYPAAGIFGTAYLVIKENNAILLPAYSEIPSPPWEGLIPNYFRSALGFPPFNSSSVLVPKHILEEFGGFPVGEKRGEDRCLWGRIALKYPVAFTWQVGAAYFMNARDRVCVTTLPNEESSFTKYAEAALNKQEIPSELQNDLREYTAKYQIVAAKEYLASGRNIKAARRMLKKARSTSRFRRTRAYLLLLTLLPQKMISIILKLRTIKLNKITK